MFWSRKNFHFTKPNKKHWHLHTVALLPRVPAQGLEGGRSQTGLQETQSQVSYDMIYDTNLR